MRRRPRVRVTRRVCHHHGGGPAARDRYYIQQAPAPDPPDILADIVRKMMRLRVDGDHPAEVVLGEEAYCDLVRSVDPTVWRPSFTHDRPESIYGVPATVDRHVRPGEVLVIGERGRRLAQIEATAKAAGRSVVTPSIARAAWSDRPPRRPSDAYSLTNRVID